MPPAAATTAPSAPAIPPTPPSAALPRPGSIVELFAGVGGFALGLTRQLDEFDRNTGWRWSTPDRPSWQLVWGNQWEPSTRPQHAFEVYTDRMPDGVHVNQDLRVVLDELDVPLFDGATRTQPVEDHPAALPPTIDLLVGGYPCQDYSIAKPLSSAHGLGGSKGALWWQIARILQQYRPRQVLLENVDRLLTSPASQRGRDFAVTLACFGMLGYRVEWRVVNAADYGFPSRRRRTFIHAVYDGGDPQVRAGRELLEGGLFSTVFPATFSGVAHRELTFFGRLDPHEVSENYRQGAFPAAGVFAHGAVTVATPTPRHDGPSMPLGSLLQPATAVDDQLWLPERQVARWEYLKGAKREQRTKVLADGREVQWEYAEGAMAFPDPSDRPSRTILTSEGGASPSRTTHVVAQDGRLRRLSPVELERAMMFPDGWTEALSPTKRAFTMGNALVVGVVAALAGPLAERHAELAGCT